MENRVTLEANLNMDQLRQLLPELAEIICKNLEKSILEKLKEFIKEDCAWSREKCCEYLDISAPSLDALRRGPNPALKSIRIGRSIKIMKSEVERFVQSSEIVTKNFRRKS